MNRYNFIKVILWMTAVTNLGLALFMFFPGLFENMAQEANYVRTYYSTLFAWLICLFGGVYVWLALQKNINKPLLTVAMIGKYGCFILGTVFYLKGAILPNEYFPVIGDLFFAGAFSWFLFKEYRSDAQAT